MGDKVKKKFIIGLLFLLININALAVSLSNYKNGDINIDGLVNVKDYILVRQHLLKIISLNSNQLKLADFNGDGKISSADYIQIKKQILGLNNTNLSIPTNNNAFYSNSNFIKGSEKPFGAADPSIIYENGTYYLFATTGGNGVRYYSSTDMTNWKDTGYIIDKQTFNGGSQKNFNAFWAPEVFKYNGKYYLLYSGGTTSNWNIQLYLAVSNSMTGPWTYYTKIPLDKYAILNIDGTVLIENNKVYLYYHAKNEIYGVELSSDLKSLVSEPKVLFYPNQSWAKHSTPPLNEGPAIIKNNGKYYLMYSANDYYTKWYGVGFAVSNSPLGPFSDVSINTPLLSSSNGPGHNSIFTIDGKNYYIVYHSLVWNSDGTPSLRKLNVDQMGIDAGGSLYVNGPTDINQPLPSGHRGKYKLNDNEYNILINNQNILELKDIINYNVSNTSNNLGVSPKTVCKTVTTDTVTIDLKSNKKIEDIWLYGEKNGFQNTTANIIINNNYTMNNVSLGSSSITKIQLPKINDTITSIKITFSKKITLSEIGLYTFSS